jgi:MFS family permease
MTSETVGATQRRGERYGRNLVLLAGCQAVYYASVSIDLTLTALAGLMLAASPFFATVPLACLMASGTVCATFAGVIATRVGYARMLVAGGLAAVLGGLTCALAIYLGSFTLFCIGTAIVGVYRATGGYVRFLAADSVPEERRSNAMSFVLLGGLVAAFIGPLAATSTEHLAGPMYAGSYITASVITAISIPLVLLLRGLPEPLSGTGNSGPVAVRSVVRTLPFAQAMTCLVVASVVMTLMMAMAPIGSEDMGHSSTQSAAIIQWHLVGMFAPSLFSGLLLEWIGARWVSVMGAVALAIGSVVGMGGGTFSSMLVDLVLIGVAWNFLYVSGTAYLLRTYPSGRGGRVQGLAEGISSGLSVLASTLASTVYFTAGWGNSNIPGVVAAVLVTLVVVMRRRERVSERIA